MATAPNNTISTPKPVVGYNAQGGAIYVGAGTLNPNAPAINPVEKNPLFQNGNNPNNGVIEKNPAFQNGQNPNSNQSTIALSSNKAPDILNAQNTTNQYAQGGVTTNPETGVSQTANGAAYTPYQTPEPAKAPKNGVTDMGGYVGETYYAPGSTLPLDSNGNYMSTTASSSTSDAILKSLNSQLAQSDALTAQMVSNIGSQYETLQRQQELVNKGNEAASQGALFRSGAAQGDAYAANTQNYQIQQGVNALADLATKKQTAILQAQQAGQAQDFALQEKYNNKIADIAKDQAAAGQKLSDDIQEAVKKTKEDETKAKTEDAITQIYNSGTFDPSAVQQKLRAMGITSTLKDTSDTVALISGIGGSGDIGDYNMYKAQTKQKGLAPLDFQAWKDAQDAKASKLKASEAYSNAYNSAAGKAAADAKYSNLSGNDTVSNLAQQLVSGNIAPSELSKRATGTTSYNAVLKAADDYSMATTGQHFNIATADRDYKFAQRPQTQDTLNYLKSLVGTVDPDGNITGGNLDELKAVSDSIDRSNLPALNNAAKWAKLASGDPKYAQYQAVATEVADQVAKILQGGTGGGGTSDAKLQQAVDLFNTGFSKAQLNSVITSLKPLLANRAKSMVGDNPYLKDYADDLGVGNNLSPKSQVNSYISSNPSLADKISSLYDIPGATDDTVLQYIKSLNR